MNELLTLLQAAKAALQAGASPRDVDAAIKNRTHARFASVRELGSHIRNQAGSKPATRDDARLQGLLGSVTHRPARGLLS